MNLLCLKKIVKCILLYNDKFVFVCLFVLWQIIQHEKSCLLCIFVTLTIVFLLDFFHLCGMCAYLLKHSEDRF